MATYKTIDYNWNSFPKFDIMPITTDLEKLIRHHHTFYWLQQQHSRGQSLLAPRCPTVTDPVTLQDVSDTLEQRGITPAEVPAAHDLPLLDDTGPEHYVDIHTKDDVQEAHNGEHSDI